MIVQTNLPEAFSQFLDKTLPAIAKAADSRRNKITELTEHFVSNFKEVVQEHLGDYALGKLEELDSLIVQNLEQIENKMKTSKQYLDFNLDRYTGEFTQDGRGNLNGLNIYIGVDNQGLSALDENSKASLLRDIAVNIQMNQFNAINVSNALEQGCQDVYRIAIPLKKLDLPRATLN